MSYHILLTIDVEDWFQVENFKQYITFSSWPSRELRIEKNTHKILDLLDRQQSEVRNQRSISTNSSNLYPVKSGSYLTGATNSTNQPLETRNSKPETRNKQPETSNQIRATFFVLGWIAERLPHLVQEIHTLGHEVASHGYNHNLCNQQSPDALKKDLTDSKKLLEDIISTPIYGYRAPSFSIDKDILKIIQDCGYLYDSSYNSFSMHGRYGHVDLSQNGKKGIAAKLSDTFYEVPVSNIELGKCALPLGGGGYFRLMPLRLFEIGVKSILRKHGAYLFYMHPWEVDPEQPRVGGASPFFKFRQYVNLDKMASKLSRLVGTFNSTSFVSCHRYLENIINQHKTVNSPIWK